MHCSWVAAAQHHCCVVEGQCRARADLITQQNGSKGFITYFLEEVEDEVSATSAATCVH